jgi:hypothetical protein
VASENFTWYQEWDKVVDFNMAEADIKWFTNAKVNIVKKLYRQTSCKKGDKTAIILNQMIQMKKLCIFRIMNCTNVFAKWQMS